MNWVYKGNELTDDAIPAKAQGFIYIITYTPTGQRYIGRKLLTKAHRRQQNKKIIRSRVESDWREYWSSSPEIKAMIEREGTDNFVREVLVFADTKGLCTASWRARQESNLYRELRKLLFYPLNYGRRDSNYSGCGLPSQFSDEALAIPL